MILVMLANECLNGHLHKIEYRSCARGVSGVAPLITTNEQLQLNRGCYLSMQTMPPEGFPFISLIHMFYRPYVTV